MSKILLQIAIGLAVLGSLDAPAWAEHPPGVADAADDARPPMSPGWHHLAFDTEVDGKPLRMTYAIYLPPQVEQKDAKLPMAVFLVGGGELGNTLDRALAVGPGRYVSGNPAFRKTVDFILLIPQCPRGMRWEHPGMDQFVVETTKRAMAKWPVDESRVYLTGLSHGGGGCWYAARADPKLWAVVSPMCPYATEPQRTAKLLKQADVTVWICVGGSDGAFTQAAHTMHEAFMEAGVDARLTVVPGMGHGVWGRFYSKPEYWDWLKQHSRKARPGGSGEEGLAIAGAQPPDKVAARFDEALELSFSFFRPHWQIGNCGASSAVGRHAKLGAFENVFVTRPRAEAMPCRLMTTWPIDQPNMKLVLRVAHREGEAWQLRIQIDHEQVHKSIVDAQHTDDGWKQVEIDLEPWAGDKAYIEVFNDAHGDGASHAVWGRIDIVAAEPDR